VRLVRELGRTPREVASDLGCSEEALRNWLKQADLDAGRRTDGLTTGERDELRRLRAENRVLRLERDLLKNGSWACGAPWRMKLRGADFLRKAAAFFAKESDRTP
jgi:transposase